MYQHFKVPQTGNLISPKTIEASYLQPSRLDGAMTSTEFIALMTFPDKGAKDSSREPKQAPLPTLWRQVPSLRLCHYRRSQKEQVKSLQKKRRSQKQSPGSFSQVHQVGSFSLQTGICYPQAFEGRRPQAAEVWAERALQRQVCGDCWHGQELTSMRGPEKNVNAYVYWRQRHVCIFLAAPGPVPTKAP